MAIGPQSLPDYLRQPNPAEFMLASQNSAQAIGRNFLSGLQLAQESSLAKDRLALDKERVGIAKSEAEAQRAAIGLKEQAFKAEVADAQKAKEFLAGYSRLKTLPERLDYLSNNAFVANTEAGKKAVDTVLDLESKAQTLRSQTAEAKAGVALEEFRSRLLNQYGLAPNAAFKSPEWDTAATNAAIDDAEAIATDMGVTNLPATDIPVLGNGQLNEKRWRSILTPLAKTSTAGMAPTSVVREPGKPDRVTFEPDSSPKFGESQQEFIDRMTSQLAKQQDPIGGKAVYTPAQAAARAREIWNAARGTQGEGPSAGDVAAQAERFAKSQGLPFMKTVKEAESLKSGSKFVGPDGKIWTRK